MRPSLSAFLGGLIFALGLGIGGMADPANVLGFLDIAGDWDYRLVFVMGGAIAVHAALRPLTHKRERPLFAAKFPTFSVSKMDPKLLVGSALFGVGWGLRRLLPRPRAHVTGQRRIAGSHLRARHVRRHVPRTGAARTARCERGDSEYGGSEPGRDALSVALASRTAGTEPAGTGGR